MTANKYSAFMQRRARLLEHLGDGVAMIPTAPERVRNRDAHYPYRFDSYFWYLSGFPEPEAVVVLVGGTKPRSILFCRSKNEERETWDGFRYGPEAACREFGFDEAWPIESLEEKLPELMADRSSLWYAVGQDQTWDGAVSRWLNAIRAQARSGKQCPGTIHDLRLVMDEMRLIKDGAEQKIMVSAAEISSRTHARVMAVCRPGMMEYQLEAELSHGFRHQGAAGHAYAPIVAGGSNACVLHYVENDQPLRDGSLVLIDAGCELEGYAADITRTFPVNGRFSPVQKDCYEIVLAAQYAAIDAIRPGAGFMSPHDAAVKILVQGMVDLGLLAGTVDGLVESGDYRRFYMHRTSHWLGLDVHDAGEYKSGSDWVSLKPGMVLTVEPGLYIRGGKDVPEHLHGIGIRIEDDALVTPDGCHVYTHAPKTVAEIEEIMAHG